MTAAASKTVERDRYNRRAQRFIEQAALADLDISGSEAIPIELRTPYIRFEEILLRHASPGRQVLDLSIPAPFRFFHCCFQPSP